MATTASPDLRMTSAEFLALVDQGVLGPEDKVELLEGVLVTMAPSGPLHASIVTRTHHVLYDRLRGRAAVRSQVNFVASALSVPEPDITDAPGDESRSEEMHPQDAHLLVEVAASSVAADRLSKSRIYAAAGIPSSGSSICATTSSRCFAVPTASSACTRSAASCVVAIG